ncbi:MAG: phosphatidate cytidylyltransferase [Deltaproteobacteria bacterium]|nr:phosphatidate cytidylyltransferase [Deltaproteobacteria bacterium]
MGKPGNLTLRVVTAAVLVPIVLLLMLWHRHEGWFSLVALVTAIGASEVVNMAVPSPRPWDKLLGVVGAVAVMASIYWLPSGLDAIMVLAGVVLGVWLSVMLRPGSIQEAGARVSGLFTAVLYAGVLFAFVALLKRLPQGWKWLVLLASVIWLGDTGAYFTGRAFGKHKLYPTVSPKKTWEGAFGGLVSSLAAGAVAVLWYLPELHWMGVLFGVVPAAVFGQAGDLCESLIKRAYGVKDSGRILPGHGGILDRVDALLFAAPYLYFYATRFVV